jgi:hypothetical protein
MFLYEIERIALDKNSDFNFDDVKYLKCFTEPSRIANKTGIVNCLKLLNERLKVGDRKYFDIYLKEYKILINDEMKFNRNLLTEVNNINSDELFKEQPVEVVNEESKPKKTKKVANVEE